MKPLQFKVTNKAEYDDLMRRCEGVGYKWINGAEKPTEWSPIENGLYHDFPIYIELDDNYAPRLKEISCGSIDSAEDGLLNWQLGQSLPKTALESLISIPENPDGSITISPELQAKLVVALRGGTE